MEIINSEGILPKWFSTCVCRFTPEYSNPQKDRTGWSIVDIVDAIYHNLPHISRCPTFLSISGLLQSPWLSARIILGLLYLHRKEVAWPNRGTVALWTPSVPGPSVRDPEECRFTQLITLTPFLLGYFQGLQL